MPDKTFDVETYNKGKDGIYRPILDGTGEHFLIGSITDDNGKSKIFRNKDEMWEHILEEGRKARKSGHCLYAYAHNIKYDFYNLFKPEKNLVVLSEFPFIAIYYVVQKVIKKIEDWERYKIYLDLNKKSYRYQIKGEFVEIDLKQEAVRFVDTMSLFRMSLKKIGEMINFKKLDLPKELKKEDLDKEEIIKYVVRDTEVLMKAVKMLKEKIRRDGIKIKRLVTMNQVAISYLLKLMKEELEKEGLENKVFSGIGEKLVKGRCRRKVRKAYRGGRVEAWGLGINKGVSSVDVNSLYPYSATKIRFPDLKSEIFWNKPLKKDWDYLLNKIGVCRAMMYNKSCELGFLPIRLPNISYFPKRGNYMIGTWTNSEILKALKEGYEIINIQFIVTYEEIKNPFNKIMNKLYDLRMDKEQEEFNKSFYKSVMNGGIGKFAQTKVGQEIVFDNIDFVESYLEDNYKVLGGISESEIDNEKNRIMKYKKDIQKFKYKGYYCPILPALITAKAREIMYDLYCLIGKEKLIYSDTDNITFRGNIKDIENKIKIGNEMGELKVEFENVEFECWGRKSKRINEEIRASGVSNNDLRNYDSKTGKIRFAKMQGLTKDRTGLFLEQEKDLKKQTEMYLEQEKRLKEQKIFIDETILKDIRQENIDNLDKDDIIFFKENIKKVNNLIILENRKI